MSLAGNVIPNPFQTDGFLRRGDCGDWPDSLLWLENCSDAVVAVSFLAVAALTIYSIHMRRDAPFRWLWLMFAITTALCGLTHGAAFFMTFHPAWWFDAYMRAATAVGCLATLVGFFFVIPQIKRLVSPLQVIQEHSGFSMEVSQLVEDLDTKREILNTETRACLARVRARLAKIGAIRKELNDVSTQLPGGTVDHGSG